MPRGSRKDKRGKMNWSNKKAMRGRRGALGSSPSFTSYKQVQAAIRKNRTKIVVPAKPEAEPVAVAEAPAPEAPAAE